MRNALIAFAFVAATALPAWAQQTSTAPPLDRSNPERDRQQDINQREMLLRGYGLRGGRIDSGKKIQALAEQVEQDFNRILVLHNEIVRAISGGKRLDYSFVSDATTEIRKRALRLQATLALQPAASEQVAEQEIALDDGQVKEALITLCMHIKNFVTNPVIEKPGTVNGDHLNKARKDLQSVTDLSFSIKRTSERLAKTHK
jgi:hypothetical protein